MGTNESAGKLVEVARVYSLAEADVIRASLEAAGVPVFVPGTTTANTLSHLSGGLNPNGMAVLVPAPLAAEARTLIEEWPATKEARRQAAEAEWADVAGEAEDIAKTAKPQEAAEVAGPDEGTAVTPDEWARDAYRAAMLAIPMPLLFIPVALINIHRTKKAINKADAIDNATFKTNLRKTRAITWGLILFYGALLLALFLTGSIGGSSPLIRIHATY